MRVGVICRANNRGLGIQTMEAARHLDASVLVVDLPNASSEQYPTDFARFPDAQVVTCHDGWQLDERAVGRWLNGLDVVWTAETFYDPRFADWAAARGIRTVVHANPEFVAPGGGWGIGNPTAWWAATSWRIDQLPAPAQVVPFPVAADRFTPAEPHDRPCRWLHVAGKPAIGDRNGTTAVLKALRRLQRPCSVRIVTQEPQFLADIAAPAHVTVEIVEGGVEHYWDLYADTDALILPRRYGGPCLPVQEAMAAGLAVAMTDIDPNPGTWPILPIPATDGEHLRLPAGHIHAAHVKSRHVADAMDALADPAARHTWQRRSRAWADAHSWDSQRGTWLDRLAHL